MRAVRGLIAATTTGLMLVGCGSDTPKAPTADIEKKIKEVLSQPPQNNPRNPNPASALENVTVDCPDDVEAKKNEKFKCPINATNQGTAMTGSATVQLTDDTGKKFEVWYKVEGNTPGGSSSNTGNFRSSVD
jgi:hypothetical protein